MLPLASAGGNLSSIMDKQLLALPALQLPPPGSKTLPPSINSNTKPRVPALPLAALPAPTADTTSEAAPAAQQPLPVVVYKPKAKPVETAFGYRVPSGGAKQSSRSGSVGKSSILDSSYGSAAITPCDDKAAGSGGSSSRVGLSREGSMLMGPLSLPDSRGNGSTSNGRFFDVGGSMVPLSPRAGQRKAEAFSSNGSNSSGSSKIPKPPAKAGGRHNSSNSGTSSKARSYRASAAQDEAETIFLDCDGESTHTGGQSKPVGFTLSCAINAVFNVAGGSSGSSGSGGGMEASSLIQTMGAALSRSIMSATQQQAGSHAQQREPVRGASRPSSPARNRRSSNGNNSYTPKQAAASPSTAHSSRGSVSAGAGSGGARSRAQSGGSTPTTKMLQILPATSNFRAVGDSAGAVPSSSATVAGSAAQAATTIFMQIQGNAAGQQATSSRGASSPTGSGYDSAFYSCAPSEATSVACSEAGSDKGGTQQQQQLLLAPRSRVLKAAGPSILDPAASLSLTAHTTGTDGELVRYMSANTAASWTTASEVGEIVSVEDSEQQRKQAQGQQQQLKAGTPSMLHSSTPLSFEKSLLELEQSLQSLEATAAAAAAAEGIETATNAVFAGKAAAADAHEREVVLTITPRALPFLAARAFSQTPVRLVITQDAVWGDLAAFTAAAGEDSSSSSAASGEGQTKKKKKKAVLFSRSARSSRCA